MPTPREWLARFWSTLHPSRPDADLEQELRLHLELAAEDARRRVDAPPAAGRAAAIRAGTLAQSMERLRDQRGFPWLHDFGRDLWSGLRTLRRNPTFAAIVLLTIAIGVGANT